MMKNRISTISIITQSMFWVVFLLMIPALVYMQEHSMQEALRSLPSSLNAMLPWMFIYFLNYIVLIPKFLFQDGKKQYFYLINIALLILNILRMVYLLAKGNLPEEIPFSRSTLLMMGSTAIGMFDILIILLAVGFSYVERYYTLKSAAAKQKQKAAEAELVWLKNQLNPHFLFNTLNNISSLTQIDADKAQESIGQLSDLLRYALYESDSDMVDLSKEIEFMDNYINLMALRCNEMTTVSKDFRAPEKEVKIAPLLFIALIENAFKHGVNARKESFVKISLHQDGHDLCFCCENSVFEKQKVDRVGSGIGLSNLKKRLDLIYPGRYKYTSGEKDGLYFSIIILKNVC